MSESEPRSLEILRPRAALRGLRDEMQRLWDAFPGYLPEPRFWRWSTFEELRTPAVDMYEKEGSLVIKADVPGMKAEDIEVSVNGDTVTISGERKEEKEVKEEDYYRSERTYGRFTRQLSLPAGVDTEKAVAEFKDGVVVVRLPLTKEAQKKTIEVKSAAK